MTGAGRADDRPERVAHGHPGGHRHLRRALRRRPVDPRRRRAGEDGEPVRDDGRPRQPDALADRRLPPGPDRLERLRARRQLRLEQGPLPGPGAGRRQGPRHAPRSSRSTRSAAAGGRSSPASPSRSRATRSPAASPTASAARMARLTTHERRPWAALCTHDRSLTAGLLDGQRAFHAGFAVARQRCRRRCRCPASGWRSTRGRALGDQVGLAELVALESSTHVVRDAATGCRSRSSPARPWPQRGLGRRRARPLESARRLRRRAPPRRRRRRPTTAAAAGRSAGVRRRGGRVAAVAACRRRRGRATARARTSRASDLLHAEVLSVAGLGQTLDAAVRVRRRVARFSGR